MQQSSALRGFAVLVLVIYSLYALSTIGMTGLLFSAIVGFFTYMYLERFEVAAMSAVLAGIVVYFMGKYVFKMKPEPFADSVEVIAKRVAEIKRTAPIVADPEGMSSNFTDGFAAFSMQEGFANPEPDDKKVPADIIAIAESAVPTTTVPAAPKESKEADEKESFSNSAIPETPAELNFLFKPGELPTEKKDGYHIDAGSTILNALNSLKPMQIEAMTADTQKLMETQKSLLGMLNTMRPMLADVKPLMETFGGLFNAK